MLPNVLQTNATDHVPVLAEEVRELLDVEPGETVVDGTFGAGGHSRAARCRPRGRGQADRDRPRPGRPHLLRPLQGDRRRVQARFLRGEFSLVLAPARRQRRAGRRDPARPRRLVDAARPARARLLVRRRRAARHADGPVAPSSRRRELVNEADERELGLIFKRYGEERYARQIARAIVRRRVERPFERTIDLVDTIKHGDPDAGPVRRRPSGQARLPGAADRGQRRARRARGRASGGGARCSGPAAASP